MLRKKSTTQKISFEPVTAVAADLLTPPQPASRYVPEWFKSAPRYMHGDKVPALSHNNVTQPNTTFRGCSPFFDALTAGYIWAAPADIEVRRNGDEGVMFRWRTLGDFVTDHSPEQHPGLPVMQDSNGWVMKWAFHFTIHTPAGYSCLFTHPANRHDLPFRTFTGVVDTDAYPVAVQFPFELAVKSMPEVSIIEQGTPLCQIIPFRRDEWESSSVQFDPKRAEQSMFALRQKISRSYRSQFWHRKKYV